MSDPIKGVPGKSFYAGYEDETLISPDGTHTIILKYMGEPPHGDSYHSIVVDGVPFPGLAWAGMFAWSTESRYFCAGWMEQKYERKTLVIDCERKKYFVIPDYYSNYKFQFPILTLSNSEESRPRKEFQFDGTENWITVTDPITLLKDPSNGESLDEWYKKLTQFWIGRGLTPELAVGNTNSSRIAFASYTDAMQILAIKQILGLPLKE